MPLKYTLNTKLKDIFRKVNKAEKVIGNKNKFE